jgi:pyruvate formate-lyase/glycerol dehydratase family glycyl radical enzyme
MSRLSFLKAEVNKEPEKAKDIRKYLLFQGFAEHLDDPVSIARAYAIQSLFTKHEKHIYKNDLIVGSIRGIFYTGDEITDNDLDYAARLVNSYGANTFKTNADHYAPNYETFLSDGISGTLDKIEKSAEKHKNDIDAQKKLDFLKAAKISMQAFREMVIQYGEKARLMALEISDRTERYNLLEISRICFKLADEKPETYREALQLIWLAHVAFVLEGRYAMALGRLDQYLYPYYANDVNKGILTRDKALELMECTLYKIYEHRYFGGDDVVNIAIAGVKRDGSPGLNEVSYIILEAVRNCNIPGPNLSARLYKGIPDEFIDECLKVIGTGLGYPAMMNDEVNIPALHRHGYSLEDSRNYCMVGCIENFITGKQPPWSDGRYNTPKYLELALNNGKCMLTGVQMGPKTGEPSEFDTMEKFIQAFKKQMIYGAADYMARFRNENDRYNKTAYTQPFLSCFCDDCIERGLDINDGGAVYPSVHGAGCMGIATVADSLAAIEDVVYNKKMTTLTTLRDALMANFEGYDDLRNELIRAPKYGNNIDFVDKYAVWYVDVHEEIFSKYRTRDGGPIYIAIASNVNNISAGREVAATPDGRKSREPLSDAASPAQGADKRGPTAVVHSITKPDYRKVSCGTVLNQKYSPEMFKNPEKRAKLLGLIKVYFSKGGQEIQINSVSREVLKDAMENPQNYKNLVVRVSGFSAFYITLDRAVQNDILERTEHG